MTDHEDDRLTSLYQKMPKSEPSSAIDDQISMAARRNQRRSRRSTRFQWLATAAVLVLGIGLQLRVFDQLPTDQVVSLDDIASETTAVPGGQLQQPSNASARQQRETLLLDNSVHEALQQAGPATDAVRPRQSSLAEKKFRPGLMSSGGEAPAVEGLSKQKPTTLPQSLSKAKSDLLDDEMRSPALSADKEMQLPSTTSGWCGQGDLEQNHSREDWQARIEQLQQDGDTETATCLQQLYGQRFNEPLEHSQE